MITNSFIYIYMRSKFFEVRKINADIIKNNNFLFICYFEICKMLHLFLCMHQIYILHETYIRTFSFIYVRKMWRYILNK